MISRGKVEKGLGFTDSENKYIFKVNNKTIEK